MTRIMYDATDASLLPVGGDLYAGYVDGDWPSYTAIKKRFPNSLVVGIATNPNTNDGIIGDGPPDKGTWSEWINWVIMRRKAGIDPWINTNEQNNWSTGKSAFLAANVGEPHWWVADYDGNPVLPDGALMKQYASNNDYDTSSCAAYLPGIDPAPVTPPPPPPVIPPTIEDIDMLKNSTIIRFGDSTEIWCRNEDGKLWHIASEKAVFALEALGCDSVTFEYADLANLKAAV